MDNQKTESDEPRSGPGWSRRAIAGLLAGTGLAALIGEDGDAKKKKKKKKKKPKPAPTCQRTCGGRTCGSDGCGGSCGSCGGGKVCEDGQCLAPDSYEFERNWGSFGSTAGTFNSPWGIAVDEDANVYVADSNNDRIQKFSSDGTFVIEWGGFGTIEGTFDAPAGIATGPSGQVYVADSLNNRIQRSTNAGGSILSWGSLGTGNGEFMTPQGIAVHPVNGNVYVVENGNKRLQIFSGAAHAQTMQLTYNGNPVTGRAVTVSNTGRILWVNRSFGYVFAIEPSSDDSPPLGAPGSGDGQFNDPSDIAVDADGNIFVADRGNHRIQVLTRDGDFITSFGEEGSGDGQFRNPIGIDLDSSGNVYVTDLSNNRVQKFRPAVSRRQRKR